jgi:hypothetical protein
MKARDGRKLVNTKSQYDVRIQPCTRWQELCETIIYHAQLAALLQAPTRFVLLNPLDGTNTSSSSQPCPPVQEYSIAERGAEWIPDDLEYIMDTFSKIEPCGVTPLTDHLRRIFHSIEHLGTNSSGTSYDSKIVLVVATDGKPTDMYGFSSPDVDRDFEDAIRRVQTRAFVVIRLCTNDEKIIRYYQRLDGQLELQLEVLDDYLDEAKEVHAFNPWLTYSLSLHRCRETGLAYHPTFRVLDWLDERPLTREEIVKVIKLLGIIDESGIEPRRRVSGAGHDDLSSCWSDIDVYDDESWKELCQRISDWTTSPSGLPGQSLWESLQRHSGNKSIGVITSNSSIHLEQAFKPWNPIQKKPTPFINSQCLKLHGSVKKGSWMIIVPSWSFWIVTVFVAIVSVALQFGVMDSLLIPSWIVCSFRIH